MKTTVRSRQKFNDNWYFTRKEIGPIPKNHQKSALIGGYTNNAIDEKGSLFLKGSAIQPLLKVMHRPEAESEHEYKDWFAMPSPEKGKEGWEKVKLPHDAVIDQNYVVDFKNAMYGFLPQTIGYYRKTFTIPKEDEGKKIFLEFDGVGRISDYWLNGCYLGENFSGYNSFQFDVTDLLKYGEEEGENVLLVKIDTTSGNEGWWYEGGGIYRNVWLTKMDKLHVDRWGTYLQTTEIGKDKALVKIETIICNEDIEAAEYTLKTSIISPDGEVVAEDIVSNVNEGMQKNKIIQEITVSAPLLWDIDSPKLYKAVTEVIFGDKVKDDYETTFGIRNIEYTTEGLFLNGKHIPIKGMSVHQDFAGVGVALPDRIHEFKIQKLKEAGVNAYRCAHNPPAPELLETCDRLGMLVMNEGRLLEASEVRIKELEAQVLRDRNHPSVFMWSISNEEFIGGSSLSIRMHKRMRNIVKSIDPSRLVTSADIFGSSSGKHIDVLDVIGVNYIESDMAQSYVLPNLEAYPEKLFISTENVMKATTRGCYEDSVEKCSISCINAVITQMSIAPETAGGAGGTCPPEKAWEFYLKNPRMGGMFVWTGFDYRGEPFPFFWPSVMAQSGTFDLCGLPKDNFYLYQAMWIEDKPVVHLLPHWTWPGKEGTSITIRAITNCEEIELILNGKSLGRKEKAEGYYVDFDVQYIPGELIAKGYNNGIEVSQDVQKTAGAPASILLSPHRTVINADGEDVSIITAAIVDENGIVVPDAGNIIEFKISSNGNLIGTGNGNPMDHDSDKTSYRNAFNGYCIAIVQASDKAGTVTIEASSEGLTTAITKIILVDKEN
jgi:beta-galactosidase